MYTKYDNSKWWIKYLKSHLFFIMFIFTMKNFNEIYIYDPRLYTRYTA